MLSIRSTYEWVLNGLSGLVAVILVVALVIRFIGQRHEAIDNAKIEVQPGQILRLPNTDWAKSRRTLVMVLQVGCQWCEASAGFYQELLRANVRNAFHTIAVLPQSVSESRNFLHILGVDVADVRQFDLRTLGIGGTPTLVLVDSTGHIQASWIGQLSPELEDGVFDRLGLHHTSMESDRSHGSVVLRRSETSSFSSITARQFVELYRAKRDLPIVDIDPRPEFALHHIAGALNIPIMEIGSRAIHEVPKDSTVVVFCNFRPSCQPGSMSERLQAYSFVGNPNQSYCGLGEWDLQQLGFRQLRVLSDDLAQLAKSGVRIASSPPSRPTEVEQMKPESSRGNH
jgi:thioredoxin-related protein